MQKKNTGSKIVGAVRRWWSRVTRGYDEVDVWSLNQFIINKIHDPFIDFIRYQEEHGKTLPIEFRTDPAAWLIVLSKIEYAISHEWRLNNEPGYLSTISKMTETEVVEHDKKMDEGFSLLGVYLRDLWD